MPEKAGTPPACRTAAIIEKSFAELLSLSSGEAQWFGENLLNTLADAAQVALLYQLAKNARERYGKLAGLYADYFLFHNPYPAWVYKDRQIWSPLDNI